MLNTTFLQASSVPVWLFEYTRSLILIQNKGMNSHFNELYLNECKSKGLVFGRLPPVFFLTNVNEFDIIIMKQLHFIFNLNN